MHPAKHKQSKGKENDMESITIQSFEHLMETIKILKKQGATSYVGCCCEAFYMKRLEDFEGSGMPAILIDIDSETCYDLGKEINAHAGKFERRTEVNIELLRMVLNAEL